MGLFIEDGQGAGFQAGVTNDNRVKVATVGATRVEGGAIQGQAWNFDYGTINHTSATESGVLYVKNTDPLLYLVCSKMLVSIGKSTGSPATDVIVRVYSNPTGGTLISNAVAAVIANKNFGLSVPPAALVYKGLEGYTVTGGTVVATRIFQDATHQELDIADVLAPGSSFAITVQPHTSNTAMLSSIPLHVYQINSNNA